MENHGWFNKRRRLIGTILSTSLTYHFVSICWFCTVPLINGWTTRQPASTMPPNLNELHNATCGQVCEYDGWFSRARCDERGLFSIPSSPGCSEASTLDFQGNHIRTIDGNTMAGYSRVETLDISENSISDIGSGTFNETPSLTNLLFSNNALRQILEGSFVGADAMERLYLDRNELVIIEVGALSGLKKLTHLDLSFNRLQSLARGVFEGLVKLKYLSLNNNKLNDLHSDTFRGLSTLQSLHLEDNNLTFLPANLFAGLVSLQQIYLANNKLSQPCLSPKSIGIISPLKYYDIRYNNFTDIACMIPYIELAEQLLGVGNPLICNCDFQRAQEWYLNVSMAHPLDGNSDTSTLVCTHSTTQYRISDGPLPPFCDVTGSNEEITTDRSPTTNPLNETTENPIRMTNRPLNGDLEGDIDEPDPICPTAAGRVIQTSNGMEWYHWVILATVLYSAIIQSLIVLLYIKRRVSSHKGEYPLSNIDSEALDLRPYTPPLHSSSV